MKVVVHLVGLLLFFASSSLCQNDAQEVAVVRFWACPHNETGGSLIPFQKIANGTDSFSLCFRYRMAVWQESSVTLVNGVSFFLTINFHNSEQSHLGFSDGSQKNTYWKTFDLKEASTFLPNKWNTFCFTYNESARNMKIVINGNILVDDSGTLGNITMSQVVIGRVYSSSSGQITELNIWSKALSVDDILKFSSGNNLELLRALKPDILDWSKANITKQNSCTSIEYLKAVDFELNSEMLHKQEYFLFEPTNKFDLALKICNRMNAKLFYPRHAEDLDYILKLKNNISSNHNPIRLWTPFRNQDRQSTNWTVSNKRWQPQIADFGPWKVDSHDKGTCMIFNVHSKMFQTRECDLGEEQAPFVICELDSDRLIFTLQAGCPLKDVDKLDFRYILWQGKSNEYTMYGTRGVSKIVMEAGSHSDFTIQNFPHKMRGSGNVAKLKQDGLFSPFGIRKWTSDICQSGNETYILLSNCKDDEFLCASGECIPSERRCDGVADCEENYDEKNCSLVRADEDLYQKETPPLGVNGEDTKILVNLNILTLGSVNELDETFQLRFSLKLGWKDWRLSFVHLKNDSYLNVLKGKDRDTVWIPSLTFENSLDGRFVRQTPLSSLRVRRDGQAVKKHDANLNEYLEYQGTENPIIYENSYDMTLTCGLELRLYPFDTQHCFMNISAPEFLKSTLNLVKGKVQYFGEKQLPQFRIEQVSFANQRNQSQLAVEFTLHRIISYHLTNTFIPTISLVIVSEVTLFFHCDHLMASAGLTLTVMLVMYTMYQSISATMTKTAYLKMLDYWLLFCLLTPFVIFMIEVFWILKKPATEDTRKSRFWKSVEPFFNQSYAKVIVPTISCLYMMLYIFVAIILSYESDFH